MNLTTLAKLAGVSVATVSKAFSGSREISEETREKIFSIAREHNCFDKYNKNKFDKKVIAVIAPELGSDYYNTILSILNREITEQNGIMTVSIGNFSAEKENELFAYYSSYCKADGIIIVAPKSIIKNDERIPAVTIGHLKSSENVDLIRLDMREAIHDAVAYLKSKGHTKIGFVGEALTLSKLNAFRAAMCEELLPVRNEWMKTVNERFEKAGILATDQLLAEKEMPTAILAAYDYIAIGIIKRLKQKGYRVPEDISVIGMDDISIAPFLETSLSSIRTHTEDACRTAVELIMKKTKNQYFCSKNEITYFAEFIPRSSSGNAPQSK